MLSSSMLMPSRAWSRFRSFEHSFDAQRCTIFTREHAEIPIFAVALYLLLVFQLPLLLEHRAPMKLRPVVALWNGLLALFSIVGGSRVIPALYTQTRIHGFHASVCTDPYYWYRIGPSGLWMTLFVYSKIPELLDTLFLVLQKKKVIFLHWFHHTTVLLYCWHAFHHEIGSGIWFAAMNYGVHAIMYSYYCAMALRLRKVAMLIAPVITVLQILQMVMGATITVYSASVHINGGDCKVDPANYRLGLAMYLSYFALFCMLFYSKYLSSPAPSSMANADAITGKRNGITADRMNGNGKYGNGNAHTRTVSSDGRTLEDFCTATAKVARNTDGGGFFHVRNDSITPPESNETSPTDIKKIK